MAKFEQKILNYEAELNKVNLIIRKFDENLAQKCGKTVIDELYKYTDVQFAQKAAHAEFVAETRQATANQQRSLEAQDELIEFLKKSLYNKIAKDIKAATAHLRSSPLQAEADGVKADEQASASPVHQVPDVQKVLERKADKHDVRELLKTRSSKKDSEMAFRQIDILHRQLKQLALLFIQKLRSSVENEHEEARNVKMNKKVNLLHHGLLIGNWVSNFDVQKVNDCFDDSQLDLPEELREAENNMLEDIKKIEKMQLSRNNVKLNETVRGNSVNLLRGDALALALSPHRAAKRQSRNRPSVNRSVAEPTMKGVLPGLLSPQQAI